MRKVVADEELRDGCGEVAKEQAKGEAAAEARLG